MQAFGEWYFRYIYRNIIRGTAVVTDAFDWALSDFLIAPGIFAVEILIAGLIYLSVLIIQADDISAPAGSLGLGLIIMPIIFVAVIGFTYMFNRLRRPLVDKLGLQAAHLDKDAELAWITAAVNRTAGEPLCLPELSEMLNRELAKFVAQVEGCTIKLSRKVKLSKFSKHLLSRGIGGFLNPYFQEIVLASDLWPEVLAHEKAHLAGYARETDAQLAGYLIMRRSSEPGLQYLAMLMRLIMVKQTFDCSLEELRAAGLADRTCEFLAKRQNALTQAGQNANWYNRFKQRLSHLFRAALLLALREKNVQHAYHSAPLSFISACDPPTA